MLFLGLDLSLNATGVVLLNENYSIIRSQKLHVDKQGAERLYLLEIMLNGFLGEDIGDLKLACIESSAYKAEGKLFHIGQWAGIVELNLYKLGIPTILAAPLQLKKYAVGKGTSEINKAIIIKEVYKKFNEDFNDDNICDAYVVGRIAHDYFFTYIQENKEIVSLYPYQESVLKVIHDAFLEINKGQRI